jgi:asparagine synthetase B (glutamine-hydrolysing)
MSRALPSFQENLATLNVLRRHLADWVVRTEVLREVRFPFLDRDLLEFLYAIPREQVVGVGKRRFLMKRALANLVPGQLLNRRRKAFLQQQTEALSEELACLTKIAAPALVSSIGIVDAERFSKALQELQRNDHAAMLGVIRTLTLESWLRHLIAKGILMNPRAGRNRDCDPTHRRAVSSDEEFS